MEQGKYKFLFPFEKVKANSNIIIYGLGIIGIEYLKQIELTKYCNVVAVIDKNYKEYLSCEYPVCPLSEINKFEFDYVVIALRALTNINAVKNELMELGIKEEKLVAAIIREEDDRKMFGEDNKGDLSTLAYQKSQLSFAILVSGGIGDLIIEKRFVQELIKCVPDCVIDIYVSRHIKFAEYLYSDVENVNRVIADVAKYNIQIKNYGLAVHLQSTRYIEIDGFLENHFQDKYLDFIARVKSLRKELEKDDLNFNTLVHSIYQRRMYHGYNAYTALGYNGAFDITDNCVDIPLLPREYDIFTQFQLKDYITVNYGNGAWQDSSKVAKVWPFEYFEKFVSMFKEKYPNIDVIQLGDNQAPKIKNIDKYILGEEFGTVAHVLNNSLLHIDIEGGLVHMASQLGTKCIVLFGPTPIEYLGYSNNINIKAGNCHNCYGVYKDTYKCARDMERPECMYSITPKMVMENVNTYLKEIKYKERIRRE